MHLSPWMRHAPLLALPLLLFSQPVSAQVQVTTRVTTLATLFRDIYGPSGLVVDSENVLPDGSTHSAHFNSGFQSEFTQINTALASSLTALPLPTPASGFTYAFDTTTGTFVRTTQSFGPILTDRAETIGRGRLSFGYTFQHFSFGTLEGEDLRHLPAVFTHDEAELGGGRADIVTTNNTIDVSQDQVTGILTYGLTDRLDVSVAVPILHTSLSVVSTATIVRLGTADPSIHFFRDPDRPGGFGNQRQYAIGGAASGLGDIVVRVKGTVLRRAGHGLALGVDVRAPSGDAQNLLGAGAAGIKPFAALSFSRGRLSPHVNVAYQWNGESVLAGDVATGQKGHLPNQVLLAVGADFGVSDRVSLAVDVLGQRLFDSPRLIARTFVGVGDVAQGTFPDVGFATGSFSVFTGAAGMKIRLARSLLADFNVRFRLNEAGLVARAIPLVGLEYGF